MKPVERWVQEVEGTVRPDRVVWCDGSEAENARLIEQMLGDGTLQRLNHAEAPGLVPAPQPPDGRRAHRAPHLHLPAGRRRTPGPPTTGCRPAEAQAQGAAALRRRDEGPHDVRRALRHGPARLALQQGRRRDHRQPLRRRQHAHHDAHGPGRARPARQRRTTSCPGLHSLGDLSPDRRFIVHFPEERHDLERRLGLRRQRAPRQEVLRAAHRLDHGPRRGLDGRAHADPRARAAGRRGPLRRAPRSRPPAARPTSPCWSRRSRPRATRCARSATTSPGCAPAPTAGSGR